MRFEQFNYYRNKSAVAAAAGLAALTLAAKAEALPAVEAKPQAMPANMRLIENTDNRAEKMVAEMDKLVSEHSHLVYKEQITFNGNKVWRYVANDKYNDPIAGVDKYERFIAYIKPGHKIPISFGVVTGSEQFRFKIGEEIDTAALFIYEDKPHEKLALDVSARDNKGRLVIDKYFEVTSDATKGAPVTDLERFFKSALNGGQYILNQAEIAINKKPTA